MSAETTTKPQLRELGWRLRRAEASDVPGGREPSGWVYCHESGARTPPQETPEQALAAARAVQDAWDELSAGRPASPEAGPATPGGPAGEGGRGGKGFAAGAEDDGGEDDADEGPAEVLAGRHFVVGDEGPKAWRGKAGPCVMRDGKRVTLEFEGGETHTFNYDVLREAAGAPPAAEAGPACELPGDLVAAGWSAEVAADAVPAAPGFPDVPAGAVRCHNAGLRLTTSWHPEIGGAAGAARRLQAREEKHRPAAADGPAPGGEPAALGEFEAPADDTAGLADRLLDWLSDNGVLGERDAFVGPAMIDVATPKALTLVRGTVRPGTILEAAETLSSARVRQYVLANHVVLCRDVEMPERVEYLARLKDIRLGVWPEGEEFPLPLSLFAPTLAEVITGRLRDEVRTLPEFQALVKNYRLDRIMSGDADPERFTLAEVVAIKEALDECARGLGMRAAEEPAGGEEFLGDVLADVLPSLSPSPEAAPAGDESAAGHVEVVGAAEPDPAPAAAPLFAEGPAPLRLSPQMRPEDISTHPSLLMRAGGLDPEHVEHLREVLRSGAEFKDDVVVFFDGERHWLADGNHRHRAAKDEGGLLGVDVRRGTLRDAILWAVRSNAEHGKGRSNDDKRLAVVTLLADAEWHRLSDTALSGMARVSQPFVGSVRKELAKILPLLTPEASVESVVEGSGAPLGLVEIVLDLPGDELERLTQNVMGDDGRRVGADGVVRRQPAQAEEASALFGEESAREGDDEEAPGESSRFDVEHDGGTVHVEYTPAKEEGGLPRFVFTGEGIHGDRLSIPLPSMVTSPLAFAEGWVRHNFPNRSAAQKGVPATDGAQPDGHGGEQPEELREPESPPDGDALSSGVVVNDRRRFADAAEVVADVRGDREEAPGAADEVAPAPAPREEKKPAGPTVEEVIGARPCSISYTWIPGVGGKVSVVVNVGGRPPQEATRQLVAASALGRLPEPVMELLKADAAKKAPAAKKPEAKSPAASRKGAAKKGAPAAKKGAAKKGASKKPAARASKKGAAKKGPAKSAAKSPARAAKR